MEVKVGKDQQKQIKVFISYSHESDEHKRRMLSLADKLNQDGINCSLDQSAKNDEDFHFAGLLRKSIIFPSQYICVPYIWLLGKKCHDNR